MKRFLLKSLAFVMMIGYSFSIFAATTPAANDGKWYYVKSQRYESGKGPFWTIGTDKVVPDAMTKSNSQKFTLISIGAEGKVGVQAYGTDGTDGLKFAGTTWTSTGAATGWTLTSNVVSGVQGWAFPGENAGIHQGASGWSWEVRAGGWYDITDFCTFFFYEARVDINLQIAIDDAIAFKNGVVIGTGVGQTPQSAVDNFQTAITTASGTLNSTNETDIQNAISALATATTTLKEAKVPIVTSSTESAPVWYLIKNVNRGGKGSTVFTTTPNGRLEGTSVANSIPADGSGTGSAATKLNHLFRFEKQGDDSYKMINAAQPTNEVLRTANGGGSSQEVKCGTPNGSTWNINLIGYNATLEVNEVKFVGVQVNTIWHMAGHFAVVSWDGGSNTPSAWYVEQYTGDVSALYQVQYDALSVQYAAIADTNGDPIAPYSIGTEPGQYDATKFNAMKTAYSNMTTAGVSSPSIVTLLTALTNAIADFKASKVQPVAYGGTVSEGVKYTLQLVQSGAANDGYYLTNPRTDANNGTDGTRPYATFSQDIDETTTTWYFVPSTTAGKYVITSNRRANEYVDEEGRVRDASGYADNTWTTKTLMQNTLVYDNGTSLLIVKIDNNSNFFNVASTAGATLGRNASTWSTFRVSPYSGTSVKKNFNTSSLAVRVSNRIITVDNVDNFEVYSISGQQMNHKAALQNGVYIVKAGDAVQKVLVK